MLLNGAIQAQSIYRQSLTIQEAHMLYLGISEDMYDSGVTLMEDNTILFASNEERYTRRKNEGGFPHQALAALLKETGINPADLDRICVCGHMTPPLPVRFFPFLQKAVYSVYRSKKDGLSKRLLDFVLFHTPISHTKGDSPARKLTRPLLAPVVRRKLPKALRALPIGFTEHHTAHAAAAWFASGFDTCLCITADGMGDALSMTVSKADREGGVQRLWSAPAESSFGLFFEMLSQAFGFTPCRDEGKITGLAAHGDPGKIDIPSPFSLEEGQLIYTGPRGLAGVKWIRKKLLTRYDRNDISAWAQHLLEHFVLEIAAQWIEQTGLRKVAVSGGIFANVKLNQRLHELSQVEEFFVLPNMGDGGLSLGAICEEAGLSPEKIQHVFLGDSFDDDATEKALGETGLPYTKVEDPEETIAELLADNKIVARFHGAMEWGPRALGNRSILARAVDPEITSRLNTMLSRSDFMPFAPALLLEDAALYCTHTEKAQHAAEFMTVCFRCTEKMAREHAPVVHVDGTARAQFVSQDSNPSFHRILHSLKEKTGSSVVLNTSFNYHEEPITRTPQHAIGAFLRAGLDALMLGTFLVTNNNEKE